jgi:hypothetical protein
MTASLPRRPVLCPDMGRVDKRTLRWIREVGLPELSEEQIEALAARLREAYAAEQAQEQIGADPSRNVGGETWPDVVEDGGPVMLDTFPA